MGMQGKTYAGRMVASRGPGEPLFFLFSYEAKGNAGNCVAGLVHEVIDHLQGQGFCLTNCGILGYCQGQKIKVFDGAESTRVHEGAHKFLHGVWPNVNRSFNEGWAYALEDHLFDRENIANRTEISLRMGSFHEWASEKLQNGGLNEDGLKEMGFDTGISETPVTPVMIGDDALTHKFSDELFNEGVFAQGIVFPTVPKGKGRIRTIVTAEHSKEELQEALDAFGRAGKTLGLL